MAAFCEDEAIGRRFEKRILASLYRSLVVSQYAVA